MGRPLLGTKLEPWTLNPVGFPFNSFKRYLGLAHSGGPKSHAEIRRLFPSIQKQVGVLVAGLRLKG